MSSAQIHRLVAFVISLGAWILFLALWISGGDDRNADHFIWMIFSLAATCVSVVPLAASFSNKPMQMDWAAWAFPLPFLAAGIISTLA